MNYKIGTSSNNLLLSKELCPYYVFDFQTEEKNSDLIQKSTWQQSKLEDFHRSSCSIKYITKSNQFLYNSSSNKKLNFSKKNVRTPKKIHFNKGEDLIVGSNDYKNDYYSINPENKTISKSIYNRKKQIKNTTFPNVHEPNYIKSYYYIYDGNIKESVMMGVTTDQFKSISNNIKSHIKNEYLKEGYLKKLSNKQQKALKNYNFNKIFEKNSLENTGTLNSLITNQQNNILGETENYEDIYNKKQKYLSFKKFNMIRSKYFNECLLGKKNALIKSIKARNNT